MAIADPLGDRLGLNVPYEWWPGVELLAEIEEAGFDWVQLPHRQLGPSRTPATASATPAPSPRRSARPGCARFCTPPAISWPARRHPTARSLEPLYAAECGAEQVVYHEVHPPRSRAR